jgi:hypothetical protein
MILMKSRNGEFCQELLSRLNVSLYLAILSTISREGIYMLFCGQLELISLNPCRNKEYVGR